MAACVSLPDPRRLSWPATEPAGNSAAPACRPAWPPYGTPRTPTVSPPNLPWRTSGPESGSVQTQLSLLVSWRPSGTSRRGSKILAAIGEPAQDCFRDLGHRMDAYDFETGIARGPFTGVGVLDSKGAPRAQATRGY